MRDYRGFSYSPDYGYTLVKDGQKIPRLRIPGKQQRKFVREK
jgi:hypothetical protein